MYILNVSVDGEKCCLSILCQSCRFDYQQRVLHTCLDPGYLHPEDMYIILHLHLFFQVVRTN